MLRRKRMTATAAVQGVRTTCPYCGVGCGIVATRLDTGEVDVKGDTQHPANFGRLCSKGAALAQTLSLDDRLLHPRIGVEQVSWDTALDRVAREFQSAITEHGPDSVAFYVSGQLLTEDYYVANKLMKGFIGSANIDTNSRLCMASSVAGHRRAFGSDTVPGCYEDIELADLVVLVGSNLAWCHPVLYQRLDAARTSRGIRVVVIDPRATATCEIADQHLAIAPGSDVALFNGLLQHIAISGVANKRYITDHTSNFDAAVAATHRLGRKDIAKATGLSEHDIATFYDLFIATEKVVTIYSQGVNQSTQGTDKVNAIINCHLATGRIGRPGMGPFSVTGQPNAMGGREVGGLANTLAAHMSLESADDRDTVQRFWGSPRIAQSGGLKAVDLFRAVADGRIKALWIMATNPVDSMPQADVVRDALARCPFVVMSDVTDKTDTAAYAHVLLPALAWGEKGGTVTNSERRISRQRPYLKPPGDAKPDWWHMAEVGKRMGYDAAFDYAGTHEIFSEHARMTAFENGGRRDLDIGAYGSTTLSEYDELKPFQWPTTSATDQPSRFFANGGYFTSDRRARFVATPYLPPLAPSMDYPLVMNTGRVRDQWHTMTRTAKAPRLMSHIGEPYLEMHPDDAAACGLEAATLADVASVHGRAVLRVQVTARQRRGSVFAPMHWTDQFSSGGRVNALVPADADPISGQPGLKQAHVRATPFSTSWHGLAIMREKPRIPSNADYWALAPVAAGWKLELAGLKPSSTTSGLFREIAGLGSEQVCDELSYQDRASGRHRVAVFDESGLVGALFVAREPVNVSRSWAAEQLSTLPTDRLSFLAGRGGIAQRDRGATVCACFDIGINQIADAIKGGATSVAAVGVELKAGTNCGSCRAEIGRLVHAHANTIADAKAC
jgi:assimilatory nitrate reductase catalytic subunit